MLLETLWQWDLKALYYINVTWGSPETDQLWLTMTQLHKLPWVVFGVLPALLGYLVYIYKVQALKIVGALALTVALTDTLCYRGIKSIVHRPRPFENPQVSTWLRKVGDAHGSSFPSNHAANCFGGAAVLAWYFRRQKVLFYSFAGLVALSRPALGVHYPSDALAGAILGVSVASLVIALLFNRIRLFRLPRRVSSADTDSGDWRLRSRRLSED